MSEIQSMLQAKDDQTLLKNLWMLSPSVHSTFRKGHVKAQPFTMNVRWTDEDEIEKPGATEIEVSISR